MSRLVMKSCAESTTTFQAPSAASAQSSSPRIQDEAKIYSQIRETAFNGHELEFQDELEEVDVDAMIDQHSSSEGSKVENEVQEAACPRTAERVYGSVYEGEFYSDLNSIATQIVASDATNTAASEAKIQDLFRSMDRHVTKFEQVDINRWLTRQVLEAIMDNSNAHIRRLFQWFREYTKAPPGQEGASIALCFCGGPTRVNRARRSVVFLSKHASCDESKEWGDDACLKRGSRNVERDQRPL